jgi:hypothetical protein
VQLTALGAAKINTLEACAVDRAGRGEIDTPPRRVQLTALGAAKINTLEAGAVDRAGRGEILHTLEACVR